MSEDLPSLRNALVLAGAAIAVYLALVGAAQILRRAGRLRFGWTYHLFAAATGLLAGLHLSGWRSPLADAALPHLVAATAIFAAFPAVTLLNSVLWRRKAAAARGAEVPQVFIDATGFVVFAVVAVAVLQLVYGVKVPGLVAGSGVVAIIIGLAMQDLLGNLVAGISLHFEKSFTTGDWLLLDGVHARVIEISWRSTRLLTTDEVLIEVPNGHIAKQTLTNFEKPTPLHAVRATIGLHYDLPPARVQAVLREAAATVPGVCADPQPVIYVTDFADSSIVYEIKVWITDHALMSRVLSDVRSHCWYAVRRAGMEIPYPQLTIHRAPVSEASTAARAKAGRTLGAHAIFGFLGAEKIDALVRESAVVLFSGDERIIEQGAAGESMFLLVRGRVDVCLGAGAASKLVAQLGPGDCFGEMSLLTGEPRTATVIAREEVEAVEIRREAFAALVQKSPEVLAHLGELLARRQLANESHAAAAQAARIEQTRLGMLSRLRSFFQLGG